MANFDELLDMVMLENAEMDFGVLDKATTKIKDLKKDFKLNLKNKEFTQAEKNIDALNEVISDLEKYIDEISDETYESDAKRIYRRFVGVISIIGGFFVYNDAVNDISKDDTNTIVSCIKSFSSGLLIGHGTNEIVRGMSANEVKRSLRVNLASFKKEVEKLSKKYKKAFEKAQKKDATLIKESVEEIKLNIYESCHAGEITEVERDILLGIVE